MFKLDLEKAEEPEKPERTRSYCQHPLDHRKSKRISENTSTSASLTEPLQRQMRSRTEIIISIMTKPQSKTSSTKHYRPSSRKSTAVKTESTAGRTQSKSLSGLPRSSPCSGGKDRKKRQGWDCRPLVKSPS